MKIQMRFQKILMLVTLIIAALCFVFAVAFLTGGMGNVHYYLIVSGSQVTDTINALNFVNVSQAYVSTSLILSILFILAVALLYITASNSRRNYYITNYIAIGIVVVVALVVVIYNLVAMSNVLNLFYNEIDWDLYEANKNANYPVSKSALNFVLGYILQVIVLVDVAALVLNLVWKIKLMKGEKELLANGFVKEVA
jgi:NADH:ubiquinone oxidoreductase subunit 3 (subunit A)